MDSFERIAALSKLAQSDSSPAELTIAAIPVLPIISELAPPYIQDVNSFLVYCCNLLNVPLRENPNDRQFGPFWLRAAVWELCLSRSFVHTTPSQGWNIDCQ